MKNRQFVICKKDNKRVPTKDDFEEYEFLCKGFSSKEFRESYFKLKANNICFHLDYLLKKEIVRSKGTGESVNIFDLTLQDIDQKNNLQEYSKKSYTREFTDIKKNISEVDALYTKYQNLCHSLNWQSDFIYMDVVTSLIVGLGNSNVSETSMTIHHTYGIPYIPGQAIKGVFRSYFVTDVDESSHSVLKDKKIDLDVLYNFIFGDNLQEPNKHSRGNVVFFDAFPDDKCTISKDIMTPHYTQYYSGNKYPMDTESPIPIPFFVVTDASFRINYAIRQDLLSNYSFIETGNVSTATTLTLTELNTFIKDILQEALEEHGIGAKTAVDYGRLKRNSRIMNDIIEEEKKRREEEKLQSMNEVDKCLYKLDLLTEDQKNGEIPKLVEQIEQWGPEEQKTIAEYIKKYYQERSLWVIKQKDIGKKRSIKIEKMCKILGEKPIIKGK